MLDNNAYIALKLMIVEEMTKHGWTSADETSINFTFHCASKEYETAVGFKTASVRLTNGSVLKLEGEYQSEGNNSLSTTCWFDMPADATPEVYAQGVEGFCAEIDRAIDQSYARRLFLLSKA